MGADIHIFCQKKIGGKWTMVESPFSEDRHYGTFGWLADVRNYSAVIPLSPCRGVPLDFQPNGKFEDWGDCLHSVTHFTVDELLAVDYDQIVEDRRCTIGHDGGATAPVGQGDKKKLRYFLCSNWLPQLERAKEMGIERLIIGFDN